METSVIKKELLASMISLRRSEKTNAKEGHAIVCIAQELPEVKDLGIYEIAGKFRFRKSKFAKLWGKAETLKKEGKFKKKVSFPNLSTMEKKVIMALLGIQQVSISMTDYEKKRLFKVLSYIRYNLIFKRGQAK